MSTKIQASFTADPKAVNSNLMAMARIRSGFYKTRIVQIRIVHDAIELMGQGITRRIKAKTEGEADVCMPIALLKSYLSSSSFGLISFTFRQGELECGSSIYTSSAIEVTPVSLKQEYVLPINLNRISVLKYGFNHSDEEIHKMQLTATVESAQRKMKTKILEALEILKEYDVKYEDLEKIVINKIKNIH